MAGAGAMRCKNKMAILRDKIGRSRISLKKIERLTMRVVASITTPNHNQKRSMDSEHTKEIAKC